MAPIVIIAIPCERKPCNFNETLVHILSNLTSTESPDETQENYDSEGAARFIIATVLVYSLMGVFGMMLLRIKRSASRRSRSANSREVNVIQYIKRADRLMLEARRDVMKKETERMSNRLKIVRQQSEDSDASTLQPGDFSLSDSFNLSTSYGSSHLRMPRSPTTSTSLSLLMPLLPAVQETSSEGNTVNNDEKNNRKQPSIPQFVLHFPALPPLTIPQTMITTSPSSNTPIPALSSCNPSSVTIDASPPTTVCASMPVAFASSTPVTIVKKLNYNVPKSVKTIINNNSEHCGIEKSINPKSLTDFNMNDTNCNVTKDSSLNGSKNDKGNTEKLEHV